MGISGRLRRDRWRFFLGGTQDCFFGCDFFKFSNKNPCKKLCSRKTEDGQAIKRYLLSGDGLDSRPEFQKSGRSRQVGMMISDKHILFVCCCYSSCGNARNCSFWSSANLVHRPIVTRQYPDIDSDGKEEIEVLMQGWNRMCRLQRIVMGWYRPMNLLTDTFFGDFLWICWMTDAILDE